MPEIILLDLITAPIVFLLAYLFIPAFREAIHSLFE